MTNNSLTLPAWLALLIRLLVAVIFAAFVVVPKSAIVVGYTSVQPVSALPLDYWLLLFLEALCWFIVIFSLRIFHHMDGVPVTHTSFHQNLRSQAVWVVSALVFTLMAVSGILSNRFMGTSLAVVIANIAIIYTSQGDGDDGGPVDMERWNELVAAKAIESMARSPGANCPA